MKHLVKVTQHISLSKHNRSEYIETENYNEALEFVKRVIAEFPYAFKYELFEIKNVDFPTDFLEHNIWKSSKENEAEQIFKRLEIMNRLNEEPSINLPGHYGKKE